MNSVVMIGFLLTFAILNLFPAIEGMCRAQNSTEASSIIYFVVYLMILLTCMGIGATAVFMAITDFSFSNFGKDSFGFLCINAFIIGLGSMTLTETRQKLFSSFLALGIVDWMFALAFLFMWIR
jgi:hypothetical protein